jgi:hypothetical protein
MFEGNRTRQKKKTEQNKEKNELSTLAALVELEKIAALLYQISNSNGMRCSRQTGYGRCCT